MFNKQVYINRRNKLKSEMSSGLVLVLGNVDAAFNYPDNQYHFRQDSNFLYFFGLDMAGLAGIIDIDNDKEYLFGNDVTMDDVIWMGDQPTINELGAQVGVEKTMPFAEIKNFVQKEKASGRTIHFYPTYRGEQVLQLANILNIDNKQIDETVSQELIKATVKLRSVKEDIEIEEIELAVDTAYKMHTTAMKMSQPGVVEQEIAGTIEGISLANGGAVSFPIILSMNGQTLHNHYHGNVLETGRMMITDAGSERPSHYCSDITRTVPVGGKYNQRQKDIYEIVLAANMNAIKAAKPGITNKELHMLAVTTLANGLKELGIMKGDVEEAVQQGAHALFMPHGLGHMMGLDVHDMEGLGEDNVGYDDKIKRSTQFGLSGLRLGRELQKGFVFTVEPGCYFIPKLIDQWKSENKFAEFLNYDKIETFKDFGGIRIEDDVLITDDSHRVLGTPIPKTVAEVEAMMNIK